jgi:hypothetical protein
MYAPLGAWASLESCNLDTIDTNDTTTTYDMLFSAIFAHMHNKHPDAQWISYKRVHISHEQQYLICYYDYPETEVKVKNSSRTDRKKRLDRINLTATNFSYERGQQHKFNGYVCILKSAHVDTDNIMLEDMNEIDFVERPPETEENVYMDTKIGDAFGNTIEKSIELFLQ